MKSNNKISFINLYKQINKISAKKNIDKSVNDIISNNNSKLNFSVKKLTPNNNNIINLINQKEKLKFKTTKNTPNSSLKKIDLNNINDKNGGKDLSEYNHLNNIDTIKTKLKINHKNKEIFDDFFIKKIKQVYTNKKKVFNNNKIKKYEKKSKSSNKIIYDKIFNYDNNITPKENIIFDCSKTKLIKKKILNVSEFKDNNSNSNLNITNYLAKSKEYNPNNHHFNSNEDNNNYNISGLNNYFSVKNNQNNSEIIFTNNQYYSSSSEKGKNIISNNLISPNCSSFYNNNTSTNKILIKYIENKYNNLIGNKTFLHNIKHEKFLFNDSDIKNLSNKNNNIKYYIKDNFSFSNKKKVNNHSKSINKINNNNLNLNHYHITGDNHNKKYSTNTNSKNNSKKGTSNKIKIKIKCNDNNINEKNNKNNIFISNINNNINLINNKINYLSGKNANKNILLNFIKEKEHFIHRNNLYDSSKNISYKSLIHNYKNRNSPIFIENKKNKNKSISNIPHIDYSDINNNNYNKNKTENSNNNNNNNYKDNKENNLYNKENNTDINNNIMNQNNKNDNIKLLKEVVRSSSNNVNNNVTTNITGSIINKKNNIINSNNKELSRQTDSSSIIKVNCKFINKKEEKENNKKILNEDNEQYKKANEGNKINKETKIEITTDSINNINKKINKDINNKIQLNDNINNELTKNNFDYDKINQNKIRNIKLEMELDNKIENNRGENQEKITNKKIIFNDIKTDNLNQIKISNNELQELPKENSIIIQKIENINEKKNSKINNEEIKENNYINKVKKNNLDLNILNNDIDNNKDNISIKDKNNNKTDNFMNKHIPNSDSLNNAMYIYNNNYNESLENDNNINMENSRRSNNIEENNNNDKIYNNNRTNIQNISTQIKQQESDNYINHIMSTNCEKDKIKSKEEDKNTKFFHLDINNNNDNNQKFSNKNNYGDYEELLCNIKDNNEKEEEKSILTTQSRDCLYYQNELEKLSTHIKKYYSENNSYPQSGIEFYLFGREIGHGAFGKVNLCLHIASGHLVAMKTFVKKDLKYKETKEKLKNEVEVLSKLHHPFINQILDSFETDTHFFIVMEYVCGDLLSFIRKRNKLKEDSAKIIFKQIIEGLKYIHKKKIIHRDIKLDNILIDLTNTIKICDFGVSRKFEKGNLIYERCGTPAYIAPEIYAKIGYEGCQCDIWSAGITLYYILSGTLPFRGSNIQELEKVILRGEFEQIKDVSNEANNIIEGMLKIEPKKRLTIDEILKHPWLNNVNLDNRYKLDIFTEAEKNILSKYDVDYLNSSKSDLIENFTYRNLLLDNNQKKIGGNTKSVIYAPYNSCVNEDSKEEDNINIISYLNKEEKALYEELEINNNYCKFGWRVKQANINYELSNNDDFDNGLMKSLKEDEYKNRNENIRKNEDGSVKNKTLESIKDYEKIKIDKNILEYIEKNVGYDKKYLTKCLKKNIINYSTATYYLLFKANEEK